MKRQLYLLYHLGFAHTILLPLLTLAPSPYPAPVPPPMTTAFPVPERGIERIGKVSLSFISLSYQFEILDQLNAVCIHLKMFIYLISIACLTLLLH